MIAAVLFPFRSLQRGLGSILGGEISKHYYFIVLPDRPCCREGGLWLFTFDVFPFRAWIISMGFLTCPVSGDVTASSHAVGDDLERVQVAGAGMRAVHSQCNTRAV